MLIFESADGQVEIRWAGQLLPYTVLDKQPLVVAGEVVENKRLGAVLSLIHAGQEERDARRLASKKLSLRQKERIRETRAKAGRSRNVGPACPPVLVRCAEERMALQIPSAVLRPQPMRGSAPRPARTCGPRPA